jgi:hypothetical protein
MKLDKDLFRMNMSMVKLEGKKVLIQQSQAETTKGNYVIIGEERLMRMIKLKSLKDGQGKNNEGQTTMPPKGHIRRPHGQVQRRQARHLGP